MQKGYILEFDCHQCAEAVPFSVFELDKGDCCITCEACSRQYQLSDEVLRRQLKKFTALCRQLIESEEILSTAAVGIDIGEHHVKVPFKILLTRLNPVLDLTIGDQPMSIRFRIEPCKDARSAIY